MKQTQMYEMLTFQCPKQVLMLLESSEQENIAKAWQLIAEKAIKKKNKTHLVFIPDEEFSEYALERMCCAVKVNALGDVYVDTNFALGEALGGKGKIGKMLYDSPIEHVYFLFLTPKLNILRLEQHE